MTAVFRRVVVGFDGSAPAHDALALAQRLADPDGGELVLAHVDAQRSFRGLGRRRRSAQDVLDAGAAYVGPGFAVRRVERTAASAARGLTEIAEQERADLVVLGSHPGRDDGRTAPGATALRLVQGAPCAVAIAPIGLRERERFHHVGVAYDGSDEAERALAAAYALAARDGAAVTLFRAIPRVGVAYSGSTERDVDAAVQAHRVQAQEQLDAAADNAPPGVNPRTVLLHDDAPGIARECDGVVDVLFAGSRGYGPLHRVFAGSVSEALLLDATQPVVLVPRSGIAATT